MNPDSSDLQRMVAKAIVTGQRNPSWIAVTPVEYYPRLRCVVLTERLLHGASR